MRSRCGQLLVTASSLAFAMTVAAMPAMAQDDPAGQNCDDLPAGAERDSCLAEIPEQETAQEPGDTNILVTGSRIRRPNLDSSMPITSVGPQELTERGDVSLGDALNQLPSLRTTFSQANSTQFIGTAGLNQLDLRGQGPSRTLVLVNGRRHVSAIPGQYIVDVNTIPPDLLERVDIVTGGNSAIYGSDAIAGVVNFVLRRDYDGVRIRGQGGISTYGDRGNYSASILMGHNYLDNRLNLAVAVDYAKADTLLYMDREYLGALNGDGHGGAPGFITTQPTNAPNRNFDGIPNTGFVDGNPGATFGNVSLGGYVAASCPASLTGARRLLLCTGRFAPAVAGSTPVELAYNFAFLPDGTLARDDESRGLVDNRMVGGGVLGGLSATGVEDSMLLPGLERWSGNIMLSGSFRSWLQPFAELKYVHVTANQHSVQPTFSQGGFANPAPNLRAQFRLDNPFLTPQARATLEQILGTTNGAAIFTAIRFNNDLGTRSEEHIRETWRAVVGVGGDISELFNLRYEVALNWGRTETFYDTQFRGRAGNVHVARYNNATNVVLNAAGNIVCAINNDAITTNDDPACVPLDPFGYARASQAAIDYVTTVSSREQWAEQRNAIAFISGDSTGFFELPGGPVGFVLGGEYRHEDAFSAFDAATTNGETFLNSGLPFEPPSVTILEAFAELRIPLLRDLPFAHELTIEGAARYSDYDTAGGVWAYNAGAIWAPVRDLRFRASYGRAVRAPNLLNLFQTQSQTFANNVSDPCDQPGATAGNANNNISSNPNRPANCAALGIPTTITYTNASGAVVTVPWHNVPGSGITGFNQGNADLAPETSDSWTFGFVVQPRWIPGLSLSVDYYRINIENIIAGLNGQTIMNLCVDDPGGIDNQFCDVVFRRTGTGNPLTEFAFDGQATRRFFGNLTPAPGATPITDLPLPVLGPGFLNQPFNFAAAKTSGIDADLNYRTNLTDTIRLNLRAIVSWVENREQFASITVPDQSTRLLSTLGDPEWQGVLSANVDFGRWDVSYNARYVGKQILSGFGYTTFFEWDGVGPTNPDARPFVFYDPIVYHSARINIDPDERMRFYVGIDNISNELPPLDLAGIETGQGAFSAAVYPNTGRFFYAGAELRF